MSTAINLKRQRLHQQIRTKDKEKFFLEGRMRLLESYQNHTPVTHIINQLTNRIDLPQVFQQLSYLVNGSNSYSNTMQLIELGLIHILIGFMNEGAFIRQTLELLSFIIQRIPEYKNVRHTVDIHLRLYHVGFLQYLLKFIKLRSTLSFVPYFLNNFTQIKDQYREVLLLGNGHHVLINQFLERLNSGQDVEMEDTQNSSKFYTYILGTFQNLVSIEQGTNLDLTHQKRQILDFVKKLIERRVFVKKCLGIIYEYLMKNTDKQIEQETINIVNVLLQQATMDSGYLQNLGALIYKLQPDQRINYKQFFIMAIPVKKMHKTIVKIMQNFKKKQILYSVIPTDQSWWQKLLTNIESDHIHQMIVESLYYLKQDKDWVWRFLSQSLSHTSLRTHYDSIVSLNSLIRSQKDPNQISYMIQKHRITDNLDHIANTSSNHLNRNYASQLVDYILGDLPKKCNQMKI